MSPAPATPPVAYRRHNSPVAQKTLDTPTKQRSPELLKLLSRLERLARAPQAAEEPERQRDGLTLTNEAGLRRKNPPWRLVEQAVRDLDPGAGNSYCCLSLPCGSYMQALCGLNGLIVERRLLGTGSAEGYIHLRGCYRGGPAAPERLLKLDGSEAGQQRDRVQPDDVVEAFRIFFRHPEDEGWLDWRRLHI